MRKNDGKKLLVFCKNNQVKKKTKKGVTRLSHHTDYTLKEFERILRRNGYVFLRQNGSHRIWSHCITCEIISVPIKCNPMITNRIIRQNHLCI